MTGPARAPDGGRRALQAAICVGALVPLSAGAAGVWLGPAMLGADAVPPDLASHFRYLSGLLLGIGIAFVALVPRIERATVPVRLLTALVVAGGLARLAGLGLDPLPAWPHRLALAMELGVTPLLCLWQARVARRAKAWANP